VLLDLPGAYSLTARYDGDDGVIGSADMKPFVVEKEDSKLRLSTARRVLSATLNDADRPGDAIIDQPVHFFVNGKAVGWGRTDDDGLAQKRVSRAIWRGRRSAHATFEGNDFYLPSSTRGR
jgi:hypothetical protein